MSNSDAGAVSKKLTDNGLSISFLDKKILSSNHAYVIVSSFLVFSLVLWLRSWPTISVPSLFVEDASHYFNNYYGGRLGISAILSRPHGYYNILNHFVGWVTGFLYVRMQPAIYVAFALLVSFTAVFTVSFSGIVRNKIVLFSMPFALGLSGLNHIFYYTTLTYQMYVLIIVLLAVALLPAPARWASVILQCVLSIILVFSGPYSVVSVPVCLMLLVLFNDKKKRVLWAVTIVAAIFYMSTSGGAAKFDNIFNTRILEKMIHTMVSDVCFLGLVPLDFKALLFVASFFILSSYYLLRKDKFFLYLATCLLVISVSSLVPFFLSTKIALYRNPYPCHVLISQFFWIVFVYFLIDRLLFTYNSKNIISCLIISMLFGIVWYDNSINKHKANVKTNDNIELFLRKIKYAESLNLEDNNEYVIISSPGARQVAFTPRVRVGSLHDSAVNVMPEDDTVNNN